jgi:MinD superfamily P-loop ATPase
MKIAVASGKGGTGKTTLAVSLALAASRENGTPFPLLLDCDVEAPDAHLFLHPQWEGEEVVELLIPSIDLERCTLCGTCTETCQFNALALLGDQIQLFPELCHGCGSCTLTCPEEAIREVPRGLGRLQHGKAGDIPFAHGIMNVGEAMAVPIIRALKESGSASQEGMVILDAPPGTSCPMVETVGGADFVLLVTEPTPSGLHDLELAVATVREIGIPMGVVINREGIGDDGVEEFCRREGLPILLRIPFRRDIAEGMARGHTLLSLQPRMGEELREMIQAIEARITHQESEGTGAGFPDPRLVGGGGSA